MFKGKGLILSVGLIVIMTAYGCSSTGGVNGGVKPDLQERDGSAQADVKGPNFLKSIDVEDYVVRLEAEKAFEYSMSPPSDPFKITAILKAVEPGVYRDRIVPGKEGIGEVVLQPSGGDGTLNVEITLTSPLEITHKQTGNVLTIGIRKESEGLKNTDVGGTTNAGKDWVAIKPEEGPVVKSNGSHEGQPTDKAMERHPVPVEDSPVHEARSITGVNFKRERDAVTVIIQGDGALKPLISSLADVSVSDKIAIDIHNVKIATQLPKEVALPLKALRWEEGKQGVRIVLELHKETPYEVLTVNDTIIVSLTTFDRIDAAVKRAVKSGDLALDVVKPDVAGKKKDSVFAADVPAVKTEPPATKMPHGTEAVRKGDVVSSWALDIARGENKGKGGDSQEITMCGKILECGTQNKIRLNIQDAPVTALLKLLAEESGCDIVVDPDVSGKVTMQVKDAPWYQVVGLIQKILKLGCDVTGNIIRIANHKTLEEARKVEIDAKKREDEEKIRKEVFKEQEEEAFQKRAKLKRLDCHLKYIPAEDLNKLIQTQVAQSREVYGRASVGSTGTRMGDAGLSGGDLSIASRTERRSMGNIGSFAALISDRGLTYMNDAENIFTIIDLEKYLIKAENFIRAIDVPKKQILIETKIIEVNNNMSDSLGINWGFFSRSFDKTGAIGAGKGSGVSGETFLADMPSTVSNLGSGIALGFINAQRTLGLDLKLQAMETSNNGKIITSPRLLTMNNEEASISQGLDVPYPIMNPQGVVSAAFKSVSVDIKIKPKITPGNLLNLDVEIKKEDLVGYSKIGGSDAPNTTKLNEKTKVIVKDGETLVLGGIFKQNATISEEGTAGLKEIPVLGWLFKSVSKENKESEYLIFITPRIVERASVKEPTDCKISELPKGSEE
ncbi:MAG: type IV pilus secretin PilQ [Nitrospirae bacterium]|nr:type IV pilus secretin PilQ [Nitrospirota bacterium]